MPSYEQMLREHESIQAELRRLEQALDDPPALHARLEPLRELLTRHFAHEEEGGYLRLVTEARPDLDRRVGALLEQHLEILTAITGAIELGPESSELAGAVRGVIDTLKQHEAGENELVSSAVNDDLGAVD